MFKHIMLATDGSELAERAADQAFALAKSLNAKVTAVTVTEPWTAFVLARAQWPFPWMTTRKAPPRTPQPFSQG